MAPERKQDNSPKTDRQQDTDELRRRAEAQYHQNHAAAHSDLQSDVDLQRLVYELQVHQIELEMQNEELVQARAEREAMLDQYTDLYDFSPVGYFTLDRDGKILLANLNGAQLLGIERSHLIGGRFGLYVADRHRADFNIFLKRVFESQTNHACELALRKEERCMPDEYQGDENAADGMNACMVRIEGVSTEDEQVCRAVVTDITERKQMASDLAAERNLLVQRVEERTAEISRTNAELMKALQTKDEFLANMSHELRTPLTAILGISEILDMGLRGKLNPEQGKSIRIIQESGEHLLAMINDILDFSKIEAGKLEIESGSVVVDDICQAGLALIKGLAHHKDLTLTYNLADPQLMLWADARRLKQIIVNLLSNAVKFTPAGGRVSLDVDLERDKGQVKFVVQDNGIGISQEDMGKLFQPFTQLDSRLSRQYEGSGLGLALVRRLVALHHGEVFVESAGVSGEGSRFTVLLPWQENVGAISMTAEETSRPASPGLTKTGALRERKVNQEYVVLLAEDNPTNFVTISEYLQIFGYQIIHAWDGKEAVEIAGEKLPDIILMDIQMPVMDGLEAIRRLRQDTRFNQTPIFALTGLVMPGDRERCFEAGANEYLTKPVKMRELLEKIKVSLNIQD